MIKEGHHRLRYDATNFSISVSPESKNLNRLIPLHLTVDHGFGEGCLPLIMSPIGH
jgi:hypothetical protein